MAETGMIPGPFTIVKSYRDDDRGKRLAVVPIKLGIETFYKRFAAQPAPPASADDGDVRWDPSRFRSQRMRDAFELARRFAALRAPVLILGERGTGKTTLASWIRATSPFRKPARDKSWPVVVCGQYAEGTMRGELFGYRKGAFTGAVEDRDGLLKAADGDTLFLDEIGDISLDVQRLLIRAVEEGTYTRLGDTKPLQSKFRLLAATNRPWPELVRDVSRDFLDRVSMLRVELPPLRDVPEELPWLLRQAIKVTSARASVAVPMLGQPTLERLVKELQRRPLPGNLRDLQLVAYRLVAALGDAAAPMPEGDAADFALQDLDRDAGVAGELTTGGPQAIAAAFAHGRPLASAVPLGKVPLQTGDALAAFQRYLAVELRREARERRVPVGDLCDVSERTLRNWAQGEE
jgi:transcriptional regulator with AAA-type ATPase domain